MFFVDMIQTDRYNDDEAHTGGGSMMRVSILGTIYTVEESDENREPALRDSNGFCDKTTHRIVFAAKPPESDLDDWGAYKRKVIRHEVIHAFLFESGLQENFEHPKYGHEETMVDWIAIQFPKIAEAFWQLDVM